MYLTRQDFNLQATDNIHITPEFSSESNTKSDPWFWPLLVPPSKLQALRGHCPRSCNKRITPT